MIITVRQRVDDGTIEIARVNSVTLEWWGSQVDHVKDLMLRNLFNPNIQYDIEQLPDLIDKKAGYLLFTELR